MRLGFINTMASNLVACYWHAYKMRLSSSALYNNIPGICQFALKGIKDNDPQIQDASRTLIALLQEEGIDVQASAKEFHAPLEMATPAVKPVSSKTQDAAPKREVTPTRAVPIASAQRSLIQDWAHFESVAVNISGPLAVRLIKSVMNKYPGMKPILLRAQFEEALGEEDVQTIFADFLA